MRVLILGGAGMLGHKVYQTFRKRFDTWATFLPGYHPPSGCDIFDPEHILEGVDALQMDSVVRAVATVKPDAIVNCIGIIKQLRAAKDPITSIAINSLFPHRLANLCRATGTRLIHMSTDCVFSGRKGMYMEDDVSDAEDLYGRTKFLGEVGAPGCLTIRTSIIGRELDTTNALLEWFLSNRGGKVRGFTNAVFSGFTTQALADVMADVLEQHPDLETFGLGTRIEPDSSVVCERSLDSTRFREATGFQPPSWPEMIQRLHSDPTPYDDWTNK